MSLPPSATPRSVAPRDDTHANASNDNRFFHRPSIASKKSIPDMGPPSAVTSYHLSSVAPSTPFSVAPTPVTPRAADAARVQPSLQ
jgi:hypothetical protein